LDSHSRKKGKSFLVLRLGKEEIDFLVFQEDSTGIQILLHGNEPMLHFSVRQVLEKIFDELPHGQSIQELIVTFHASQFHAKVVRHSFPSRAPSSLMSKAEAMAIEKDACVQAARTSQKILLKESGILPNEFSVRRVNILERKIDGYVVPQLEGYKKGEIELVILSMFLLEPPVLSLRRVCKSA